VVLSKRERVIVFVTIAVLATLVIDRYAVNPFLDARSQVHWDYQRLVGEMAQTGSLFDRRKLMQRKWQDMVDGGLQNDASKTESKVLHALRDWSEKHGVTLASVKPDHIDGEGKLHEITFLVTGTGSMSALGEFLWQVEATSMPLRIKELQIGSRREDGNDMSVQLRISAIYFTTQTDTPTNENLPSSPGEKVQ